jgi:superoxide dismutase, Fe-Mn family
MPFELPPLPYAKNALEPHVSKETLEFHHGKHHAKYVKTLNQLVAGSEFASAPLEDIVRKSEPGKLFNNAGQHWNHSFFWNCLSPDGGKDPSGELRAALEEQFGSVDDFRKKFTEAASGVFGSGWAWLVRESDGKLAVQSTANAENPLIHRKTMPLLTCDMWEHAYYIDYRNEKKKWLEAFWNVVNWEFVAAQLKKGA